MSSAILQKQAAKPRVIIKRYKRDNATSIATISNLEEKVATLDATLEQLKGSNKNALIDLITTHQSKIQSIHSHHVSSLLAEKQKLQLCMVNERQLQNSLYNEVLDTCQLARDACKSVQSYDMLSKQWLIPMKEWRSKFPKLQTIKMS